MTYPFDRLAAAMGLSENKAVDTLGVSGSTGQDYRHNGMSWRVADRLAVKAGFHPGQIWPEWIDDAITDAQTECAECGTPFWAVKKTHRFCSDQCRERNKKRRHWHDNPAAQERMKARKRRHYDENAEYYRAAERRRYHEKKGAA